jgi:hypothetical protein
MDLHELHERLENVEFLVLQMHDGNAAGTDLVALDRPGMDWRLEGGARLFEGSKVVQEHLAPLQVDLEVLGQAMDTPG